MIDSMWYYDFINDSRWFGAPDGRFIPPRHMVIKNKIRRKRYGR